MLADIERTCNRCVSRFWWTVDEQLEYEDRQVPPPTLCRRCRASQNGLMQNQQSIGVDDTDLMLVDNGALMVKTHLPASIGDEDPILVRVQELLLYSAGGYVPRTRTFVQWLRNEDPNLAEIQARQWSGQHAQQLMAARHELLRLVRDQDDTVRHRVEQHIAARLAVMRAEVERRRLAAEAEQIELQRQTARLEAAARHRALLDAPKPAASLDPLRQVAAEHRQRIQVEAETRQDILSDFFMAVENVCGLSLSLHKKALRIRAVMDAFEMDEESLPDNARRLLRAAERLRDDD